MKLSLGRLFGSFNRSARAGYDAASTKRRLSGWRADRNSINAILTTDGEQLRSRARELVRNNPYAASARESFVANCIGTGIKPSSAIEDADLRDDVQQLWSDWTDEADADGLTDFYGLQALAASAYFEAGECFIRLRQRRESDGLAVPLQLQLIEADQCPLELNRMADNGNIIRNGIEFDLIGRRVAYWFWRQHPGDRALLPVVLDALPVRVPAEQVIHVFRPVRPGQVRGVPALAPAMLKLWLLDQYDDAELDRKKVAALFAGFIKSPEEVFESTPGEDPPEPPAINLQPGTMQQLLPGEEVTFSQPADVGGSYEMFEYRNILAACAAMGVPYSIVTGDRRKANYSSERGAVIEYRRRLEQVQHAYFVFQLCRPVWRAWWQAGVISGAIDAPDFLARKREYTRARWITPRFEWVDPYKDQMAEKVAVRAGFKPLSDVIESQGEDARDVFKRMHADQQLLDKYGLVLDTDPRLTSAAGLTQARPGGSVIPDPEAVDPLLDGSDQIDDGNGAVPDNEPDDAASAA
jgi:lambda family phage portal protein